MAPEDVGLAVAVEVERHTGCPVQRLEEHTVSAAGQVAAGDASLRGILPRPDELGAQDLCGLSRRLREPLTDPVMGRATHAPEDASSPGTPVSVEVLQNRCNSSQVRFHVFAGESALTVEACPQRTTPRQTPQSAATVDWAGLGTGMVSSERGR